jgi:exopolysaccharide biosynthesis protein
MSRRKAIVLAAIVAVVLGLGAIIIALANNYLTDGAQVAAAPTTQSTSTTQLTSNATGVVSSSGTNSTATDSTATDSTATDSTYTTSSASVSIAKVSKGSGNSTVTYYVADVRLASGTDLRSAFADSFASKKVAYTSAIAEANDAMLAINGDYCTARSTGVIIRNGVLYQNAPARMGLAIYEDGTMRVYDETEVSAEQLLADGVWNTFSFGPAVLIEGVIPDGLDTTEVEDIGQQHTILGAQPRTAIGIIDTNHFVFVVVDGRDPGYSKGVTLSELGQIFKDLGCTSAYNLDGGGSSAMYFRGELVNNPLGDGKERGISDILFVG